MGNDINIHVKSDGTDRVEQQLKGVGRAAKETGREVSVAGRRARDGSSGIDAMGGKSTKAAVAVKKLSSVMTTLGLAGLSVGAGLAAAGKGARAWIDRLKEIKEAQDKLVESTKSLDESSKQLASQANVMGQPGGMEASRETIRRLQEKTKLSIGEAGGLAVAAHSAMGTSGQMLTPEQEAIAGVVGDFAQRKGVGSGGIAQLFKLLSSMGVTTEQGARLRVQQLSTVQQASQVTNFEEFIGAAIKSMIPQLAQGGTSENAMAMFAGALDVSGSADEAAEKTKQMAALTQNPKILQAMGKYFGTDEASLRGMSYDQRQQAFAQWVAAHASTGEGQSYLLASGLSPEQLGVASTQFTQRQLQRQGMFRGLASSATAEGFQLEAEGYRSTVQGNIDAYRAEKEKHGASATVEERIGRAVIEAADERWLRYKASGKDKFGWPDFMEKSAKGVYAPMWQRSKALSDSEEKEAIQEYLHEIQPTWYGDTPTPGEVGHAEIMLREAEGRSINIIHNHNIGDNYYPRTGRDDRGPRVAPGDL